MPVRYKPGRVPSLLALIIKLVLLSYNMLFKNVLNVLDVNCALVSIIFNVCLDLRCRSHGKRPLVSPSPSDRCIYLLLSPPQRPLCSVWGTMGRGKREERLPPFPSSHRAPRAFYFSIIAIFTRMPSEGLCEQRAPVNSNVLPFISPEWNHSFRRYSM